MNSKIIDQFGPYQKTSGTTDEYEFSQIVSHQGRTLIFATPAGSTDIYYRVLLSENDETNSYSWSPQLNDLPEYVPYEDILKKDFPNNSRVQELRPVGMSLLTFPFTSESGVGGGGYAPIQFKVLSVGIHLCIFRVNLAGNLCLDRFIMKEVSPERKTQQETLIDNPPEEEDNISDDPNSIVLERAWEVRYQNSQLKDLPQNAKDTLAYKNLVNEPFYEPTHELSFINELYPYPNSPDGDNPMGIFDVTLLPTSDPKQGRWQIFTIKCTSPGQLNSYSVLQDQSGLFQEESLQGIFDNEAVTSLPSPDFVFDLFLESDGAGADFQITTLFNLSSVIYCQEQQGTDQYGNAIQIGRSMRLMIAFCMMDNIYVDYRRIGILDFGINGDGSIVRSTQLSSEPTTVILGASFSNPIGSNASLEPIDPPDLGIYAGYFTQERTETIHNSLYNSADGFVHLYYDNKVGSEEPSYSLAVVHFQKATSAPTYTISDYNQQIQVIVNANILGSTLKGAEFNFTFPGDGTESTDFNFTTISLQSHLWNEEWNNVPRCLKQFTDVMNGDASNDICAPDVLSGAITYYDIEGIKAIFKWPCNPDYDPLHQDLMGYVLLVAKQNDFNQPVDFNRYSISFNDKKLTIVDTELDLTEVWTFPEDSIDPFVFTQLLNGTIKPEVKGVTKETTGNSTADIEGAASQIFAAIPVNVTSTLNIEAALNSSSSIQQGANLSFNEVPVQSHLVNGPAIFSLETALKDPPAFDGYDPTQCNVLSMPTDEGKGEMLLEFPDNAPINQWVAPNQNTCAKFSGSTNDVKFEKLPAIGGNKELAFEGWVDIAIWLSDSSTRNNFFKYKNDGFEISIAVKKISLKNTPGIKTPYLVVNLSDEEALLAGTAPRSFKALFNKEGWQHVAVNYLPGTGLRFQGGGVGNTPAWEYVNFGNNASLNATTSLYIQCIFKLGVAAEDGKEQVLISKSSYELLISDDGIVILRLRLSNNRGYEVRPFMSANSMPVNVWMRVMVQVDFEINPNEDASSGSESTSVITSSLTDISIADMTGKGYGLGSVRGSFGGVVFIGGGTEDLIMGARKSTNATDIGQFWGDIAELSIGNQPVNTYSNPADPGIVGFWRMNEGKGEILHDEKGLNPGKIINASWQNNIELAEAELFINGVQEVMTVDEDPDIEKMTNDEFKLFLDFTGSIADIRLWNKQLTPIQIRENMWTRMRPDAKGLIGYWRCEKSEEAVIDDAVITLIDSTVYGNDGQYNKDHSMWEACNVPVSNERLFWEHIHGAPIPLGNRPMIAEYSDVDYDASGNLYGLQKRCYLFQNDQGLQMIPGYKVGDLKLDYIGQAQSKPSLIGFIEGAPPVPAENLTVDKGAYPDDYFGTSSVEMKQVEDINISYNHSSTSQSSFQFSNKSGPTSGGEYSVGFGLITTLSEVNLNFLYRVEMLMAGKYTETQEYSTSQNLLKDTKFLLSGDWDWKSFNPLKLPGSGTKESAVNSQYLPNNLGHALVKSGTAEIYALTLVEGGSFVGYKTVPNPSIPEDWNIILFPMDSNYTEQGALDQKGSSVGSDSYFKPTEAYALKSQMEKENLIIRSQYDQAFLPHADISTKIGDTPKMENIPKRGLTNTYVWTANGGLFEEENQSSSSLSESHMGSFSIDMVFGINFHFKARSIGGGTYNNMDLLGSTSFEVTSTRAKEESESFGLTSMVDGEGFLDEWDVDNGRYKNAACEGKVEGYRFMSFYLPPDISNEGDFWSTVIDQNWLNTNQSKEAQALRQAKSVKGGPWRVMHRTTYVARVQGDGLSGLEESNAPTPEELLPINLEDNLLLIAGVNNVPATNYDDEGTFLDNLGKKISTFFKKIQTDMNLNWWNSSNEEGITLPVLQYLTSWNSIRRLGLPPFPRLGSALEKLDNPVDGTTYGEKYGWDQWKYVRYAYSYTLDGVESSVSEWSTLIDFKEKGECFYQVIISQGPVGATWKLHRQFKVENMMSEIQELDYYAPAYDREISIEHPHIIQDPGKMVAPTMGTI